MGGLALARPLFPANSSVGPAATCREVDDTS